MRTVPAWQSKMTLPEPPSRKNESIEVLWLSRSDSARLTRKFSPAESVHLPFGQEWGGG